MKNSIKFGLVVALATACLVTFSCKKKKEDPHVPPDMNFKMGGGYTSGDKTIAKGDSVLVGVNVTKTEDDLRSYNVSVAYDGASGTTTKYQYYLTAAEYGGFSKDYWVKSRNQAGSERWVFTILDKDGNIAQKSLTLTVQ